MLSRTLVFQRLGASATRQPISIRSFSQTRLLLNEAQQPEIRARMKDALKAAMKGKDKEASGTIRSLMADITYYEKSQADPNAPASEDSVIDVLRKSIVKRKQATESYPSDHPNHLSLLSEISLISNFLPKSLTAEEIDEKLTAIVQALTEEQRKDKSATGKVLAAFWEQVKKSDVEDKKALGKRVGELLRSL